VSAIGRLILRCAPGYQLIGDLHAFPALVAVHGVIAADHGCDARTLEGAALSCMKRSDAAATSGRRIAPVEKACTQMSVTPAWPPFRPIAAICVS